MHYAQILFSALAQSNGFIRINQVGYLTTDSKIGYHDDVGDYSTNEPTMDGTADAILMMALWSQP